MTTTGIIAAVAVAFAACVLLSFFYWEVFHIVVCRSVQFRLFARRDATRRIAVEQRLADSFVYRDLERIICKTVCYGSRISLLSFLWFMAKHKKSIDTEAVTRFEREAPPEFQQMSMETSKDALILMMLNSPWICAAGSLLIVVMWALGKISGSRLYKGANAFVDATLPDPRTEPALVAC